MSINKDSKKAPNLRFKGFTDDWEQRKLSDSLRVLDGDRGTNYPHESDFFQSGDTLFLNTSNVTKNGFNFNTVKYITKEKDELLRAGRLEENDFVLTSRGTLGNVGFYDHKTYTDYPKVRINSAMLILRNVDKRLSYSYLHSVLKGKLISDFMKKNQVGSAQPHITKTEFLKLNLSIPENIKEQEKIGNFLNKLENTITLHQRKLDQLNRLKEALLQQMFPGKGETVPKLRFKGFIDAWEERKLKNIGLIQTGNTPPTKNKDNYSDTGMLWVTPTDINYLIISDTEKRLSNIGIEKARIAKKGSILVTCIASIGKNALAMTDVGFNQQINSLTPQRGYDSYFLLTQSKIWSEIMKNNAASGTMQIVNKTDFSNIVSSFPTSEEQRRIGLLFNKVDNTITLQQRKLDQLQNMKQVLLQNMFI